MEQPEPKQERGRGRRLRSPVYYVQVLRQSDSLGDWATVDVTEDKRDAARMAAAAARKPRDGYDEPARVRVMASAELLRRGGQDAINRAARDLWAAGSRPDGR
jgi:hypothetical protein